MSFRSLTLLLGLAMLWGCGSDTEPAAGGSTAGAAGSGGSSGAGGAGGLATGGASGSSGSSSSCTVVDASRCEGYNALVRPFRPSEHSAVYADEARQLVLFGGTTAIPVECQFANPNYTGETWIFDDPCAGWRQSDATGPAARGRHMAAWGDGAMWLFGGRFRDSSASGSYTLFDDLWRFELASETWTEVTVSGPAPSARLSGSLAWDPTRRQLWLFGGNSSTSGASYAPLNDLWSFDVDGGSWTEHTANGPPEPRLFQSAVLDVARDQLVVFAGADNRAFDFTNAAYFDDLWRLDLKTLAWSRVAPSGSRPVARFWQKMVHDPEGDRYWLFGGHDATQVGNRNDLWQFDPTTDTWSETLAGDQFEASAAGACDFPPNFTSVDAALPERRSAHQMVWSTSCGHALVVGGKSDCGAVDDVWRWDGQSWTEVLSASEGESCRRWRDDPDQCSNLCN